MLRRSPKRLAGMFSIGYTWRLRVRSRLEISAGGHMAVFRYAGGSRERYSLLLVDDLWRPIRSRTVDVLAWRKKELLSERQLLRDDATSLPALVGCGDREDCQDTGGDGYPWIPRDADLANHGSAECVHPGPGARCPCARGREDHYKPIRHLLGDPA